MIPSLTKAKEIAKSTSCSMNLRTAGTGLNFAAEDMNDYYPSIFAVDDAWESSKGVSHPMKIPQGWPTSPSSLKYMRFDDWMSVNEYTDINIYRCPSMEKYLTLYDWRQYQVKFTIVRHYGMAIFGIGGGKTTSPAAMDRNYQQKSTEIPSPADNVAIADSEKLFDTASSNNTHKLTGDDVCSYTGSLSVRHLDMGNYLFLDGHLERYAPEEIDFAIEENKYHWKYAK